MKPVLVIAEAGINHGGNLAYAMEMATIAKAAGADIVKYQTFYTPLITKKTDPAFEDLCKLHLRKTAWYDLKQHCDELGIEFLTTPGDLNSLDFVSKLGL